MHHRDSQRKFFIVIVATISFKLCNNQPDYQFFHEENFSAWVFHKWEMQHATFIYKNEARDPHKIPLLPRSMVNVLFLGTLATRGVDK